MGEDAGDRGGLRAAKKATEDHAREDAKLVFRGEAAHLRRLARHFALRAAREHLERGAVEAFLAAEMVVDGGEVDARRVDDVAHACRHEAVARELRGRRFQQALNRFPLTPIAVRHGPPVNFLFETGFCPYFIGLGKGLQVGIEDRLRGPPDLGGYRAKTSTRPTPVTPFAPLTMAV